MSYLEKFKSDLAKLFESLAAATGRTESSISTIVANDGKFATTFRAQGRDIRVGTYDLITSRFSAIWPADLAWPEGVLRPEPAVLPEGVWNGLAWKNTPASVWPADRPWPADIPRPDASSQSISGQGAE